MEIIEGKYKGKTARLHQFGINWIAVDVFIGEGVDRTTMASVVSPLHVRVNAVEAELMVAEDGAGSFWKEFALRGDGTFMRWEAKK